MTKPCRWCGSAHVEYLFNGSRLRPAYQVMCRVCESAGPVSEADEDEQAKRLAVVAWNLGPVGRRIRRVS